MKSIGEINVDIAAIREMLASKSGVAVFVSEMSGSELVNGLMSALDSDGSRIVSVEAGDSYMDYIAPLLETEDGDTVILDGVQNVDKSLIADFLRIISDRVLVGTIGEGDNAQSFEMPMNNFNLVLIDRGGGGKSLIRNAFDDEIATDVFARGIKLPTATQETGDGDMLSLLSTFVNQCAPDSGWFDGDGQTTFAMPDGATVLATQSEYEDVGEWIETYDEMTVKHITEYNGIEFSDEAVDEYLQDSGGLFHFKFEIETLGGRAIYEFVQFGEGEIAAESSEVIGVQVEEIFSWTQSAIDDAWQATPQEIEGEGACTIAAGNNPKSFLSSGDYYVSYLQASQISDDLSSYASDGDALIGFCYSDEGIFVDKDGNVFGEDGTRSVDLIFAVSEETYAYSGYLYNSEKSEFVFGYYEGDEAHEDGRSALVEKISSYLNMSDDAISDMLYAVSCNQDDDFSEMFDDVKDTDWEYTFGSSDVISCDADDAQGRVFAELYPPVLLSASQSKTGVIQFDEDAHVEGRNEELRFVGICLE